jgi:hypothetical protein
MLVLVSVVPMFVLVSVTRSLLVLLLNSLHIFSRDSKWGSTLELSNKRFNSENAGSSHANFPPFVVPEVPPPPPPMHLFQNVLSKGNLFPRQVIEVS